jgi:hypothetical protein
MKLDLSLVYPIIGGTGKYKGAEGEFTVTRNSDTSYIYLITIKTED